MSQAKLRLIEAVIAYLTKPSEHRYLEVIGCLQSLREAFHAQAGP